MTPRFLPKQEVLMDAQERLQALHMIAENEILQLKAALQDKVQNRLDTIQGVCMYMSMRYVYKSSRMHIYMLFHV
jgi:hypothetical protein